MKFLMEINLFLEFQNPLRKSLKRRWPIQRVLLQIWDSV